MRHSRMILASLAGIGLASASYAGPIASGFDSNIVATCDDCSTDYVATSFDENFFGTSYTGLYISNNGYLTFNSGQGSYSPVGLGAEYSGQPIIAPFYADVDTGGTGTVTYGDGTYKGESAFGVTWNNVGYFPRATDKTNTFQAILTDRSDLGAGDFDIYYNYGSIGWETGDASGGADGLGGDSAAVGFNAGLAGNPLGTYFEQAGSRVPGSFIDGGTIPLASLTNDGTPGQLVFEVRGGNITVPPISGVPESATWLMMILGFGAIGGVMRRAHRKSEEEFTQHVRSLATA